MLQHFIFIDIVIFNFFFSFENSLFVVILKLFTGHMFDITGMH